MIGGGNTMVFKRKKSSLGVGLLFILTAFVGVQAPVGAAGAPPVAIAGESYESRECNSILFDASGSSDPEGAALEYRWNFSVSWTEWSSSPYAQYMWLDDFSGSVTLEVSDGDNVSSDTVDVLVMNVPPFILSVDSPIDSVEAGTEMEVAVHCFDGDMRDDIASLDTCTAVFSWGDGTSTSYSLEVGANVVIGSHIYAKAGEYEIDVTLTDDDDGASQASMLVVVNRSAVSLDALIGIITSLKIPKGLKNSLFSKLENVLHSLENHKIKAAIYQLRAFINFVEAQRGKKLSREEAKELMSNARSIIVSLKNM
jgi:hypothetical protein